MKQALALIFASGTFGLVSDADAATAPLAAHAFVFESAGARAMGQPLRAGADGEGGGWLWSAGGGSDDGNGSGSDDGNGGGSDEGNGGGSDGCNGQDPACAAGNAAPAGSVAPPRNGLFTDGTAPVVKSN